VKKNCVLQRNIIFSTPNTFAMKSEESSLPYCRYGADLGNNNQLGPLVGVDVCVMMCSTSLACTVDDDVM
jgi:hypothetical protein